MGCMFDTPGTGWFDSKFLSTGETRSRDVCFLLNIIEPNDTVTHYGRWRHSARVGGCDSRKKRRCTITLSLCIWVTESVFPKAWSYILVPSHPRDGSHLCRWHFQNKETHRKSIQTSGVKLTAQFGHWNHSTASNNHTCTAPWAYTLSNKYTKAHYLDLVI